MSFSKKLEKPPRKLKAYTIEEKLDIIERIRNGEKQADMCRELNLAESTLRGWLKNEARMREFLDNMESDMGMTRKRSRTAQNTDLDKCMFDFFVTTRNDNDGVPLSGPVLQMQAKNFNEALGGSDNFKCSRGWLDRWKKRHGVSQVTFSGETRSAGEPIKKEKVQDGCGNDDNDDDDEGKPEQVESESLVPHFKALEATQSLLKYFEQQGCKVRAQQIRSAMQEIRKKNNVSDGKRQSLLSGWLIKK